jgi:hypothetical protein
MTFFKVKLWFVAHVKPDPKATALDKAQYTEHALTREISLPFAPTKGVILIEEDKDNPWLFVAQTVGYNLTHGMFNCEYTVECDDARYQTILKSLLSSGWTAEVEK